jgi:hypothetical protein
VIGKRWRCCVPLLSRAQYLSGLRRSLLVDCHQSPSLLGVLRGALPTTAQQHHHHRRLSCIAAALVSLIGVWERLRRCGAISEPRGKISSPAKDRQRRQQNDYSVSLPAAESLSRSTAPAHRRESTEAYGSTLHSVGTVVRNYWLAASRQREFPRDACAPHRRERACSPSQTGEAAEAAARALRWSRQQRRQQWRS